MKLLKTFVLAVSIPAFFSIIPCAEGAIVNTDETDWLSSQACAGPTEGGTDLLGGVPVVQVDLSSSEMQQQFQEFWPDVQQAFGNPWSYTIGPSLPGKIIIETAKACDEHAMYEGTLQCRHGAFLTASLEGVTAPAGQQLQWMQFYRETGGAKSPAHPYTWNVDPLSGEWVDDDVDGIVDPCELRDHAPFFNEEDDDDVTWFDDHPWVPHDENLPWTGSIEFYTFLVSWDGSYEPGTYPHTVTIHDGFTWGFTGTCVAIPEPGTILMLGLGGILLRRRK